MWETIKKHKFSFSEISTYVGAILAIIMFSYAGNFVYVFIANFFTLLLTYLFLINYKKAAPFGKYLDSFIKIPFNGKIYQLNDRIILLSFFSLGILLSIHLIYMFYKYPKLVGMSDDDVDSLLLSKKREVKLNKILK